MFDGPTNTPLDVLPVLARTVTYLGVEVAVRDIRENSNGTYIVWQGEGSLSCQTYVYDDTDESIIDGLDYHMSTAPLEVLPSLHSPRFVRMGDEMHVAPHDHVGDEMYVSPRERTAGWAIAFPGSVHYHDLLGLDRLLATGDVTVTATSFARSAVEYLVEYGDVSFQDVDSAVVARMTR